MVDKRFYNDNGPFSVEEIAKICNAEIQDLSKSNVMISDLQTMNNAVEGGVCFFYDKKLKAKACEIKASACITTAEMVDLIPNNVVALVSSNPKLSFLALNEAFYSEIKNKAEIRPSAVVSTSAIIGENCFVGENVVIEDDVKLGDNCVIEHGAVISRGCELGSNCRIGVNAHISHCLMGNDCYIYSGARIGWDGFGFMFIAGQHKRSHKLVV